MRRRSASATLGALLAAVAASGCGADAPPPAAAGSGALRAAAEVAPPEIAAGQSPSALPTPLAAPPRVAAAQRRARRRAPEAPAATAQAPQRWRSVALGLPNAGALHRGVPLPPSGQDHLTYDPILHRLPNRDWRTWGTDRLVWTILVVARSYRAAHPEAPPLLIGDLSLPTGGVFDGRYGGLGHASHQNGLDVDIQYPRKDRRVAGISDPSEVDMALAQDLVDRFVAMGAQFVFVGPRVRLQGPEGVVQPLEHHDDHFHVRLRN